MRGEGADWVGALAGDGRGRWRRGSQGEANWAWAAAWGGVDWAGAAGGERGTRGGGTWWDRRGSHWCRRRMGGASERENG